MVVVGREVALGSGYADLVAVEADGRGLKGEFLRSAKLVNTMIEQLSVAPLIAEVINAIFEDKSVSEIFGGENQS